MNWRVKITILVLAFFAIYASSWLYQHPVNPDGYPTTTTTQCFLVGVPASSCPATPGQ